MSVFRLTEAKRFTSRRAFLARAGCAAAGCGTTSLLGFALPGPAAVATPFRLGIASYTFRNFTRAQMIPMLKQAGVTSLNAKDVKDHLPMDVASEAEATNAYASAGIDLHAVGAVYFPKDEEDDFRRKFEYCKRAGVRTIVAGDPTPAMLPRLERFVRQYDIRIALHNHGPEDKLWPSPLDVLKAVEDFDPRIGCCIDVGHTVRAGTDVVAAIHACGPRLYNVHMKDLSSFTSKESQVAVGEGKMPVREIFSALQAIRYSGYVDLEYEVHADDPMPGVLSSMAYMRRVRAAGKPGKP